MKFIKRIASFLKPKNLPKEELKENTAKRKSDLAIREIVDFTHVRESEVRFYLTPRTEEQKSKYETMRKLGWGRTINPSLKRAYAHTMFQKDANRCSDEKLAKANTIDEVKHILRMNNDHPNSIRKLYSLLMAE